MTYDDGPGLTLASHKNLYATSRFRLSAASEHARTSSLQMQQTTKTKMPQRTKCTVIRRKSVRAVNAATSETNLSVNTHTCRAHPDCVITPSHHQHHPKPITSAHILNRGAAGEKRAHLFLLVHAFLCVSGVYKGLACVFSLLFMLRCVYVAVREERSRV